ncbi:unnamed protein product, partial [Rotaria sp. Silwood2]
SFDAKASYYLQQFARESLNAHYQIRTKPTEKSIDPLLLQTAARKFHCFNAGHFNKPTKFLKTTNRQNEFPQEIFPSAINQDNPLSEITNYFKNQLSESWKKFLSDRQHETEDLSMKEIIKLLDSFQEESTKFWNKLFKSITLSHEQLFEIGLVLRITSTALIRLLQQEN